MAEFKHSEPNSYRIKVEAVSDDANSMLGKQLALNHIMQYGQGLMNEGNLGMIIRNMPLLNDEEMAADLTLNYDNCKNDFLAIERGEMPPIIEQDDHLYIIGRVSNRMRKPDFRILPEEQKMMYQQYYQMHLQAHREQELAKQRAQSGYIPVDGPLITVDYYITEQDENGETKTKRAKMPQRSLEWLEQQLQAQGTSLSDLEEMNRGVVADMMRQQEEEEQASQMGMMQQPPLLPQG
jgi:hypothetical protein